MAHGLKALYIVVGKAGDQECMTASLILYAVRK